MSARNGAENRFDSLVVGTGLASTQICFFLFGNQLGRGTSEF
jgi:hypothetical protein